MSPENEAKLIKVEARIAKGEGIQSAIKAEKMATGTYYKYRENKSPVVQTRLKSKKKGKRAVFVDLPLKSTQASVAIVVCQLDQIKDVLRGLA